MTNLDFARSTVAGAHANGVGLHGRLTSQFSESENAAAVKTRKGARFLPPLMFMDACLRRLHTQVSLLRERFRTREHKLLTTRAEAMLDAHIRSAAPMRVEFGDQAKTLATVFDGSARYTVKFLPDGTVLCTCEMTLEHECGCPHSWTAAKAKGHDYSSFIANFVSDFHKTAHGHAALDATTIMLPTFPRELHLMTPPACDDVILAPPRKIKKGRKSLKKRHKSAVEMTQTQTQTQTAAS
ncbi:hypothetical protein NFJ02_37g94950 [Pycnococcus provasolii]